MVNIPDAPWIKETEATGYCSYGWWNQPSKPDDEYEEEYEPEDDFEGVDGDVFYGNETRYF